MIDAPSDPDYLDQMPSPCRVCGRTPRCQLNSHTLSDIRKAYGLREDDTVPERPMGISEDGE